MKRYITSGIILVITVLTIGIYYGQMETAASNLPKYSFKTMEGNPEELNSLIINGDVIGNPHGYNREFTIENNKTIYHSEKSYVEKLTGYQGADFERLKEEYRSFMRGKEYINSYYEDKDYLAFVKEQEDSSMSGVTDVALKVSLLEKKGKDVTEFETSIPNKEKVMNISVRDIQLAQSKLQIVAEVEMDSKNDTITTELHLYTVDIAQKKIVKDESLFSSTPKSNEMISINYPERVYKGQRSNIMLVEVIKSIGNDEEGFNDNLDQSALYIFHYDTGEMEKIKWPKGIGLSYGDNRYYDDHHYYTNDKTKDLHIKTFSLTSKKITDDEVVTLSADQQAIVNFRNGKKYVMISQGNMSKQGYSPAELVITDLKTNHTLYKGETVVKSKDKEDTKKYSMFLNNIQVK